MAINLSNLFNSINKNSKMGDFQDLDHIDGVSISTTCANLYSKNMFNFVNNLYDKEKKCFDINLEDEIINKTLVNNGS